MDYLILSESTNQFSAGIDVIVQLIDKINSLQEELMEMKKRLEGIDG